MTASTRTDDVPAPISGAPADPGRVPASTDVAVRLDALRVAAGEADVLATVTVDWFDNGDWGDVDPLQIERLAYLLGLIAKAATAVVAAVDRFHGALADAQPARAGDRWDDEDAGK
jgi:hypothetical protein